MISISRQVPNKLTLNLIFFIGTLCGYTSGWANECEFNLATKDLNVLNIPAKKRVGAKMYRDEFTSLMTSIGLNDFVDTSLGEVIFALAKRHARLSDDVIDGMHRVQIDRILDLMGVPDFYYPGSDVDIVTSIYETEIPSTMTQMIERAINGGDVAENLEIFGGQQRRRK